MWYVSEVARLKLVSASIDGPSHFLVIRFEREGGERFARWIGGRDWRERGALHQLFAEAEPVGTETIARAQMPEAVEAPPLATATEPNDTAARDAPPDERTSQEERTFPGFRMGVFVDGRGKTHGARIISRKGTGVHRRSPEIVAAAMALPARAALLDGEVVEFVVGGFTDPEDSREGVSAILVGYYEGRSLRFAGKVGTGRGWNDALGRKLRELLEPIEVDATPFHPAPPGALGRLAHWVEPRLVAEVQFAEWTDDGKSGTRQYRASARTGDPQTSGARSPSD